MPTPREVFFDEIGSTWGISNKELASCILSNKQIHNGKSARELAEVRSSLSRFVVHVDPGEYTYGWLAPFDDATPAVLAAIKRSSRDTSMQSVVDALSGPSADAMQAALAEHGLDAAIYRNVTDYVTSGAVSSVADKAEVLMRLFLECGCLGDPRTAADDAMNLAQRFSGTGYRTSLPVEANGDPATAAPSSLGICRYEDGVMTSSIYRLSTGPEGTVIGSMSTAEGSINDVGQGVSRQHVRLRRDEAGVWWAEGLGSTNGTEIVNGEDKTMSVLEPPRDKREGDGPYRAMIQPGDRLILARHTKFLIMAVSDKA